MKILFLDIDGVVNCATTNFKTPLWPLDRYMAFLVGKIVMYSDCHIVLSSSWRNHPEGAAEVKKVIGYPVLDITCRSWYDKATNHHSTRGEEIQNWLDHHFETEKYAILDDDSDMLPHQMPNFFKTSWKTGITDEIAKNIIDHFNNNEKNSNTTPVPKLPENL